MAFWQSLNGMDTWQVTTADPERFLSEANRKGIPLQQIMMTDALTVRFKAARQAEADIRALAKRQNAKGEIVARTGLYWTYRNLLKRPVLLMGILFLVFLTVFLPTKILFYQVEGNQMVPSKKIIALASENGLEFGASRRGVRSEKVKNALLKAIPELEWVGINTSGCVATISVRERQSASPSADSKGVSSIVAVRGGIVRDIIVTAGSAAVQPGQVITPGQVLISGYTDCGLTVRAERAKGEVYATTEYQLTLILPEKSAGNDSTWEENKNIALIFGKNRINLSQNSGILDTSCVKMYEENYVTLPGGFVLPIGIVTEYCNYRIPMEDRSYEAALQQAAERYLLQQMVAGTILTREETISQENGVWQLTGRYVCLEMIGRVQNEEIVTP